MADAIIHDADLTSIGMLHAGVYLGNRTPLYVARRRLSRGLQGCDIKVVTIFSTVRAEAAGNCKAAALITDLGGGPAGVRELVRAAADDFASGFSEASRLVGRHIRIFLDTFVIRHEAHPSSLQLVDCEDLIRGAPNHYRLR